MDVIDARRAHQLPTGRVTVAGTEGHPDLEVATAAGYVPGRHYGYAVTRYDDGAAVVALHND